MDSKIFEELKRINEYNSEFWYARDIQKTLEYTKWSNFLKVIEKAKESCQNSNIGIDDNFCEIARTIEIGNNAIREIDDIMLSRYACYLIVMNGDPRKEVIALGQTYFAIQTRQQEIMEQFDQLSEDNKRLKIRNEMKEHNKSLSEAAQLAGVKEPKDFAYFHNRGYQGLYGGLGRKEIHERKGLKKSQDILDHMGSTELAANLFRATQTEEKLRRENINGLKEASETHYKVGKKVRKTIEELGGTMPEDLPTPEKSISQIEREQRKKIENKDKK
jgi:DNA-damage-inducible protein D